VNRAETSGNGQDRLSCLGIYPVTAGHGLTQERKHRLPNGWSPGVIGVVPKGGKVQAYRTKLKVSFKYAS